MSEETSSVKLITITPDAEKLIAYMARVSSDYQDKEDIAGLLKYCARHKHWSIFEMCNMVLEIQTSRSISPQILRHRSFSFQEFSQRYAKVKEESHILYEARRQDQNNRQNSIDDLSEEIKEEWNQRQQSVWDESFENYQWALDQGIAKECARAVLPASAKTKMYMNGTIRSWIHYIKLRTGNGTQKEHMEIAEQAQAIFKEQMPIVAEALGW
jgi:thymidylate synthase (FAD)